MPKTPIAQSSPSVAAAPGRASKGKSKLVIEPALVAAAGTSNAWPFEEARRLLARLDKLPVKKGSPENPVIFETGYGPSGLPHIGTFGEVARTTMVRTAFELLTEGRLATRLICFSDDLDGFRKVPDNVPNKDMLKAHLGKPLTRVPDPFSNEYESFAHHNNARLRGFLDRFGFDYEFFSATDAYASGMMDATLLKMLSVYDKVMAIILPTLGPERQATYAPFLPICPRTGIVLQVPMVDRNVEKGTVTYVDPGTGERVETLVTGGRVKCQWKADWAMRWTALGVDYEMAGKDLIDSVKLSSQICRALGGVAPEGFNYELFLDDKGAKISKSKGNGLEVDEWLTYASPESLALFMYQKPRAAKKLFFDVIPKTVDEYLTFLSKVGGDEPKARLENPAWHIHGGAPPSTHVPVTFGLMLNIVSASNALDKDVLWGFLRRHAPDVNPQTHPLLDQLAGYAIRYFDDFVKPAKTFRAPDAKERAALEALSAALEKAPPEAKGEDLQAIVFAVGKAHAFEPLRAWFAAIYEVLLGQSQGPRFGSFIELYGVSETRALIARALKGELLARA